jgi:hypothetical protein
MNIGMYQNFYFAWSIFWRWFLASFFPGLVAELVFPGLIHKGWIQMPFNFITLWLATIWFLRKERVDNENIASLMDSTSKAGFHQKFSFQFAWSIFWRSYFSQCLMQQACSLVLAQSSTAMNWVLIFVPFPALIAALFWVRKTALNVDGSSASP